MKTLEEFLILVLVVSLPQSCLASVMAKGPLENELNATQTPDVTTETTADPNQQQISQVGEVIVTGVQELLDQHERSISNQLKRLEQYIDYKCGGTGGLVQDRGEANSLEAAMATVLNRFTRELSAVAQSFSDNLRQELRLDTQRVLKKMEKTTADFVTKADLQQFHIQRKAVNRGRIASLDDKKGKTRFIL